jgi:hypothetical protein
LIVTTKEEVDALVGVKPQELADDLYGEHFGVGELGCGSARGFGCAALGAGGP